MKVKDNTVNIWGLQIEMQPVLKYCEIIFNNYGVDFVITSARDGIHSAGSLHYYGLAIDVRTRDLSDNQIKEVVDYLRSMLGSNYDIVVHKTHLHIEDDPK